MSAETTTCASSPDGELAVARPAFRHQAPGLGAGAEIILDLRLFPRPAVIVPQTLRQLERRRIGQTAVFVFLQRDAFALGEFRYLVERENHHLAVLADEGDVVAARGC